MRFKSFYLQERTIEKNESLVRQIKSMYLKDLKEIEKMISPIKSADNFRYEISEKDKRKMRLYVNNIHDKYEKIIYKILLAKHMEMKSSGSDSLNLYATHLQSSAWTFIIGIVSILTDLEYPKGKYAYSNFEKHKINVMNKVRTKGRLMVKDAINYVNSLKEHEKKQEFAEPTRYENILFKPEQGITEEELENIVLLFKKVNKKIRNKKLELVLKDILKVVLTKISGKNVAKYNYRDDYILIRPWGNTESTIVHELAHRYWYKYMKDDQRSLWVNAYTDNIFYITKKDVDDFVDYLVKTVTDEDYLIKDQINRIIPDYVSYKQTDPLINYKVNYFKDELKLIGSINEKGNEEKLRNIGYKYLVNIPLLKHKITDYGNTNYIEGFAEIFMNYVMNKRIPEKMKNYFLRSVGFK